MVYISKAGEVICTDKSLYSAVSLYESWQDGLSEITLNTSGSTGPPKPIRISRKALQESVRLTAEAFGLDDQFFFLCNLNTAFIGGQMMVLRAAELGCDVMVVHPSAHPFNALGHQRSLFMRNRGKNFFSFVPLQLASLIEDTNAVELLRTAGAILVGGAAVLPDLRAKVQDLGLPVYETYGMTETVSHIALKDLRTDDAYFTALPGVKLDTDAHHCLKIQSPSTLHQWVTTHDMVELLSDRTFVLKGRRDNVVNSGGIKIQCEEIEHIVATTFPEIGPFFCTGVPDPMLGQRLVLVVEGDQPEIDIAALPLPKYQVPKEIVRIAQFQRTPSGKIDKKKTLNA